LKNKQQQKSIHHQVGNLKNYREKTERLARERRSEHMQQSVEMRWKLFRGHSKLEISGQAWERAPGEHEADE
jgi:hypothetical protein